MNAPLPEWRVTIESHGRCGLIRYIEGANTILFDWEFSTGSAVAILWPRISAQWDSIYPWASGRKMEIMARVARDVIRQKAPDFVAEVNDESSDIVLRKTNVEPPSP